MPAQDLRQRSFHTIEEFKSEGQAHPADDIPFFLQGSYARAKQFRIYRSRQHRHAWIPAGELFGEEVISTNNKVAKTGQARRELAPRMGPNGIIYIKYARLFGHRFPGHISAQHLALEENQVISVGPDYVGQSIEQVPDPPRRPQPCPRWRISASPGRAFTHINTIFTKWGQIFLDPVHPAGGLPPPGIGNYLQHPTLGLKPQLCAATITLHFPQQCHRISAPSKPPRPAFSFSPRNSHRGARR